MYNFNYGKIQTIIRQLNYISEIRDELETAITDFNTACESVNQCKYRLYEDVTLEDGTKGKVISIEYNLDLICGVRWKAVIGILSKKGKLKKKTITIFS